MIQTAEEFLDADPGITVYKLKEEHPDLYRFIKENLIEFAKLHAQEALEAASECADLRHDHEDYPQWSKIDKDSILNSYPLENIK